MAKAPICSPPVYTIADFPADLKPVAGEAAFGRTTKGWGEKLSDETVSYLTPDLGEAGYFSNSGGNTSLSVLVSKRANPPASIEFTFKDRQTASRTVNLILPIARLTAAPGDGWTYAAAAPWEEISKTIAMPDSSQYPLTIGWQNTADGLLLRFNDNYGGLPNANGAIANLIVRFERPTLHKMTDGESLDPTNTSACLIAPKTFITRVGDAVATAIANLFTTGSSVLHKLTSTEINSKTSTTPGVVDGKTLNEWISVPLNAIDALSHVEAARAPTDADKSNPWSEWFFYDYSMPTLKATVWLYYRSPISNDIIQQTTSLGQVDINLTPKNIGGGKFQINAPQGVVLTYSPVRTAIANQLTFPANVLSGVNFSYLDASKTKIVTGQRSLTVASDAISIAVDILVDAPVAAKFVRYEMSYIVGGVLPIEFSI